MPYRVRSRGFKQGIERGMVDTSLHCRRALFVNVEGLVPKASKPFTVNICICYVMNLFFVFFLVSYIGWHASGERDPLTSMTWVPNAAIMSN